MKVGIVKRSGYIVGSLCKLPIDFMGPNDDPIPMLVFGPLLLVCLLFYDWAPWLVVAWGALLTAYGVWRGLSRWWDEERAYEALWRLQRGRPRPQGPTPAEVAAAEENWAWVMKRTEQQADEADGKGLLWWDRVD